MLFDTFIYNGEKDLLSIRLNETKLFNQPVTTILVESDKTHTGYDKPLYFTQSKAEEYKDFEIVCYCVNLPKNGNPKEREVIQRNEIKNILKLLNPKEDDIVIISDVDEVPRARTVNLFKPDMNFASLLMNKYAYYLNWMESEQSWDRARIMTWKYLKDKEPNDVRDSGYDFTINHAGWHFSWVIDPVKKLESFSHQELNTVQNLERVSNKENIWNDDKFKKVEVDLSYPEWLYKNQEKFKHIIDAIL